MIKPIILAVQTVPYDGPRLTRLTVEFQTLPPAIEAELAQRVYALIDQMVNEYQPPQPTARPALRINGGTTPGSPASTAGFCPCVK